MRNILYMAPRGAGRKTIIDILGSNLKYNYQKLILDYLLDNSNPYEVPVRINGEVVGKYKIDTSSIYGFQARQFYIDEDIFPKNFLEYKTRNFNFISALLNKREINVNIDDIDFKLSRDILLNVPKINIPNKGKYKLNKDMKRGVKNVRKKSK